MIKYGNFQVTLDVKSPLSACLKKNFTCSGTTCSVFYFCSGLSFVNY
jgi:hypothetical protein